ncbi:MAG: hypothetical protein Q7V43_36815, partial [Myxococcales bacterium]|nr:hypothetical protein [Myxococcales bacterium]
MQRHNTLTALATLSLIAAAGCAPVDGDDTASTSTQPIVATCTETVTSDGRDPRNAAGQIRYCWPTEAKCFCDTDNDCYALEGYTACTPRTSATVTTTTSRTDSGVRDTGVRDTGVRDSGVTDAGTADTGVTPTPTPTPTPDAGTATSTTTPSSGLRAFPGAEGFGANATGGRGGRVIYVTNLNASGPGSFQDAVQQTGPRYVLFKVSGVINGDVQMNVGDLTIAGQTSPGGIT